VSAEVALLCGPCVVVDVERVVRAAMHAALAADALGRINVDDPIGPLLKSAHWTNRHAGSVRALIAAQDGEVSLDRGEGADLGVFHPSTKVPYGDTVLALAGDGAGVTADAPGMIYDEAELHNAKESVFYLTPGGESGWILVNLRIFRP
jgi:hypothetical protein